MPTKDNPSGRAALGGKEVFKRNIRNSVAGSGGAIGLAIVLNYLLDIPQEVAYTVAGGALFLGLAIGTYVLSPLGTWARNEIERRKQEGLPVHPILAILASWALVFVLTGCLHYDGSGYLAARSEALVSYEEAETILPEHCDQHLRGAKALRDEDGESWALRGPLGSAGAITSLAADHALLYAGCEEAEGRALPTPLVSRAFAAWARAWNAGAARVDAAD